MSQIQMTTPTTTLYLENVAKITVDNPYRPTASSCYIKYNYRCTALHSTEQQQYVGLM